MKRSEINQLVRDADALFQHYNWVLPPSPKWDVTDFGLGMWREFGLVLVNLADEPEYCEKLMYAKEGMTTPAHCHARKTEDIISRNGLLRVQFWSGKPELSTGKMVDLKVNGVPTQIASGAFVDLHSGWRVKIYPGVYHEFVPLSEECLIGEVSTANDDRNDNFFVNAEVGRYPDIEEDEPAIVRLLSDPPTTE
jgi:D-lyxose ketol-isomerase